MIRLCSLYSAILVDAQFTSAPAALPLTGNPSCPCLQLDDTKLTPINTVDLTPSVLRNIGNGTVDWATYGIGCRTHDARTPQCTTSDCARLQDVVPTPFRCDLSWCQRSWCFVDPNHCGLLYRRSARLPRSDRFYSYATCGDADSFTKNYRFAGLEGQVLKIGLNSNTGGWLGAYSSDGQQFKGPLSKWSGPTLEFVKEAAVRGNFYVNLTLPPLELQARSSDFFGSPSDFDYCVYATSLGFLDLCVAQYTITDVRASTTDWLLLGSSGIYLVASYNVNDSWGAFKASVSTIFRPFTFGTWMFIVFFVIPVLGCLMIFHEFGKSGSAYPREEMVVITRSNGEHEFRKLPVPFVQHIVKSIYINFLAVMQSSYEQTVISIGAMLNLLGISFFILTIIAVFTANLAAILSSESRNANIASLDDAIRAGFRLCSERKNMESVVKAYPQVSPNIFAVDPPELGGDGEPGFTCAGCNSRRRVFEFIDPIKAHSDPRYCHAGLAPEEDLEVYQSQGDYCNKVIVGSPVQFVQTGFPIFELVAPSLVSFFLKLKNEGVFDRQVLTGKPQSQCPTGEGEEGEALGITQLSGIWVVSFGFAIAGLLVTYVQPYVQPHIQAYYQQVEGRIQKLHKRDQRGGRIEALEYGDPVPSSAHNVMLNTRWGSDLHLSDPQSFKHPIEQAASSPPVSASARARTQSEDETLVKGGVRY